MIAMPGVKLPNNNASSPRSWRASLQLGLERRQSKTSLVNNAHYGPLRVQRPFYPESDGCAHVYLLHPPGGMVLGDRLDIAVDIGSEAQALLTTPSASKFYRVDDHPEPQVQNIALNVDDGAELEWLPQETLAFEGANGQLNTTIRLQGNAKICTWDIVALGRPAAGEGFKTGRCLQNLHVFHNERLLYLEKNCFDGGSPLLTSMLGLQGQCASGTFLANTRVSRDQIDEWVEHLDARFSESPVSGSHAPGKNARWGLTQKESLLIFRYVGPSAYQCKLGFEWLWQQVRPLWSNKAAVLPRIWST